MIKKSFVIILLILAYACSKCENDDHICESVINYGIMSAEKNGEKWIATVWSPVQKTENDSIFIQALVKNEQNYLRELLLVYSFKIDVNTRKRFSYPVRKDDIMLKGDFTTLIADGDVLDDYFILSESDSSYIEISMDSENRIYGDFQMVFVKSSHNSNEFPSVADTIRFNQGVFISPLDEKKD